MSPANTALKNLLVIAPPALFCLRVLKWSYIIAFTSGKPVIGIDGVTSIATNALTALNTDGTVKWDVITFSYVCSSPIIDSDGFLYMPLGSTIYKLNVDTGGVVNSSWPMSRGNIKNTVSRS